MGDRWIKGKEDLQIDRERERERAAVEYHGDEKCMDNT